ncbi:MAG: insulinase family protein [Acidobacteria bacterium]|jgi:predicted Zn-dependent peptidase|nr:insulinase family protein [Acidobacteriota bacterium]
MTGDSVRRDKVRRIITLLFPGLLFSFFILAAELQSEPIKNKYYVLDNGLQVFLEKRDKIPLVNIVAAVNVGSKDEVMKLNGLVHLLEHLVLFSGSQSSSPSTLLEIIKKHGFVFNAHTGYDQMTIEISTPAEFTSEAFKLLKEKLFNLKLSPGDLEKEKKVIAEELSQVQDEPEKLGLRLTLKELFSGHPYENSVGGEQSTIINVSVEQLEGFYQTFFIPTNCALAVVGDFDLAAAEKMIRDLFGSIVNKDTLNNGNISMPLSRPAFPLVQSLKKNVEIRVEMDIKQAHLFLGFTAPGLRGDDKLSMDVLTRILGKGFNPLLYNAFKGWESPAERVDSLDVQYIALEYGGAVLFHLVLDAKKITQTRREVLNFLKDLKNYQFSKKDYLYPLDPGIMDYLETARAWMHLVHRQYIERESDLAVSYARFMLTHRIGDSTRQENKDGKKGSYDERLASIQSKDIQSTANEYFNGKKYVTVMIVPKEKK